MVGIGGVIARLAAAAVRRPGEVVKGAVTEAAREAVLRGGAAKAVREAARSLTAIGDVAASTLTPKRLPGAVFRAGKQASRAQRGQAQFTAKVVAAGLKQGAKRKPPTAKQLAARKAFATNPKVLANQRKR